MRRRDREISSREEIDSIIHEAEVCRLAFALDNEPYLLPISFGYDGDSLFIHTAKTGRKIEFIEANNRVCFELETNVQIVTDDETACEWSFHFESVVGQGSVTELTSDEEKTRGLDEIMRHYSDREWLYAPKDLSSTRVWRIDIESVTGKRSAKKSEDR